MHLLDISTEMEKLFLNSTFIMGVLSSVWLCVQEYTHDFNNRCSCRLITLTKCSLHICVEIWLKSTVYMPLTSPLTYMGPRHWIWSRSIYVVKLECAQRVQTSTNATIWTKSDLKFESRFLYKSGFGSGCLPDQSQNVVNSLPCWH